MIVYFDASALVKRYIEEAGSDFVRQTADEAQIIATTGISRVEVTAALARASRLGALSPDEARHARELLGSDWKDWLQIPADEGVLR